MLRWIQNPWDVTSVLNAHDGEHSGSTAPFENPFAIVSDHPKWNVSGVSLPYVSFQWSGQILYLCFLPGPSMMGDTAVGDFLNDEETHKDYAIHYKRTTVATQQLSLFDAMLNLYVEVLSKTMEYERPQPPIVFWEKVCSDIIQYAEDDPAPYSLIVELAGEKYMACLKRIAKNPKKILRRERRPERIQRVREMDIRCMATLAQRPGISIPEKAGSRQRIDAVVRTETIETLENRVVRTCLQMIWQRADAYFKEFSKHKKSKRVQAVEKLRNSCMALLHHSPLASIKPLSSPCRVPNHTLLQNVHYAVIWEAYGRLVRNEELRQDIWRWQHRMGHDVVAMWLSTTLTDWWNQAAFPFKNTIAHRVLSTHHRHQCGAFFHADQLPGPFVVGQSHAELLTIYILDAVGWQALTGEPSDCYADFYVLVMAADGTRRVIPFFVQVQHDQDKIAQQIQAWSNSMGTETFRSVLLHIAPKEIPPAYCDPENSHIHYALSPQSHTWHTQGVAFWNRLWEGVLS